MTAAHSALPLIHRLLARAPALHEWVLRHIYGLHRLEAISLIDLEAPIEQAFALYGTPTETRPHETVPNAITYVIAERLLFHEAVVSAWEGRVHEVTFSSAYADPARDLLRMIQHYGKGLKWSVVDEGYSYQREDAYCWLWYSAIPAIGVSTCHFRNLRAQAAQSRLPHPPTP